MSKYIDCKNMDERDVLYYKKVWAEKYNHGVIPFDWAWKWYNNKLTDDDLIILK